MARSAPASDRSSSQPTTPTRKWQSPPDPQSCDSPPLGAPGVYVNLGGSLRERFEAFSHAAFGFKPAGGVSGEQYLLHRLLLDADVHLGPHLRVFVQLSNETEAGRRPTYAPTDIDRGDVQQAFFDTQWPLGDTGAQLGFRGGRQEMMYGSNRLVDIREGPNIRQSFDGARAWLQAGALQVDAFWVRPVFNKTGYFDDTPDPGQQFYGAYAVLGKQNAPVGADLYVLALDRNNALLDAGVANERRKTVGGRLWGTPGRWDYNLEAAYQWGQWGQRPISAYGLFSDAGYTVPMLGHTRFALKADAASGGNSRGTGTLGTFYPLFPKNNYYTEANIQTTANNIDVYPYVQVQPRPDLAVLAGVALNWRFSTKDSFYQPPGVPVVAGNSNGRRYAGTFTNLQVEWLPLANLDVNAAYVHYDTSGFLRAAGGRNVDWVGTWASLNF